MLSLVQSSSCWVCCDDVMEVTLGEYEWFIWQKRLHECQALSPQASQDRRHLIDTQDRVLQIQPSINAHKQRRHGRWRFMFVFMLWALWSVTKDTFSFDFVWLWPHHLRHFTWHLCHCNDRSIINQTQKMWFTHDDKGTRNALYLCSVSRNYFSSSLIGGDFSQCTMKSQMTSFWKMSSILLWLLPSYHLTPFCYVRFLFSFTN